MSAYAVIETGGKQYRVTEGAEFDVERLDAEVGKKVKLDRVLALSSGDELKVGTPTVKGTSVTAEVLDHHRGDKLVVFKKKRRKGYKRKQGHRQELTRIRIAAIGGKTKAKAAKKAEPKEAEAAKAEPKAEGAKMDVSGEASA
jgi:large subunit ribosomal protein L21